MILKIVGYLVFTVSSMFVKHPIDQESQVEFDMHDFPANLCLKYTEETN